MNTISDRFAGLDIDAMVEQMDAEEENRPKPIPIEKITEHSAALEAVTAAEEAWRNAIQQRDIALAAHNEGIKLLRVRLQRARDLADQLKPRRPVGRPRLYKR
ncbi:hypothetical protein [Stenotrophomonas phage BUCT627]|uniref:Uncharacterized protein n=3 Tax=Bixiavirus TaxID=3044676 RepID=A0A7D2HGU9_9CAUD|nr:hypothetical protein PQD75_gp097 [Stenotrophomonas phage vB_SmaS_BUCT548]YP_010677373.1 hypothetical protein PQD76_gp65 [Stenotrophomonas phage BUCT626]YP_010677455.1 hypothetical protein PQD77_gp049 [Stenotrophomonas phage BUCT627]QIQ60775.1 hypothetical protein [Stenotrophomonas phage vB_SmaS_BUCT548]QYC96655.1 hypothetical protein [Stenotrophomonas phage BUCT627]QYC96769.1 hypothetical protein [Stenotrophomonas phage BUCT626]